MGIGSYVLSLQEREQLKRGNPKTAGAVILKLLAEQPLSNTDLQSMLGLPADLLERSLAELENGNLIESTGGRYTLTERGEKARFVVAS